MKLESLKYILESLFHIEAYIPGEPQQWIKSIKPPVGEETAKKFKEELYYSIENPGTVTPKMYELWTDEEFETQAEVQQKLRQIWSECYD